MSKSKKPRPATSRNKKSKSKHVVRCFTERNLAAAFTEWDRRFREEPERFQSEAVRLLKETPETYGDACAPYLISILVEQSKS